MFSKRENLETLFNNVVMAEVCRYVVLLETCTYKYVWFIYIYTLLHYTWFYLRIDIDYLFICPYE